MEEGTEINLKNRQVEVEKKEKEILQNLEPNSEHKLNQEYRTFQVGKQRLKNELRINQQQKFKLLGIFDGGKYEKSVYIDHEQQ